MITLFRHAQSTFNSLGDQSRDVPITQHGIQQAKHLKGDYDLIICSTMKRARQTLDASNLVYKDVLFTNLCREFKNVTPGDYFNGEEMKQETHEELLKRIKDLKELIIQKKSEGYDKIGVLTHSILLNTWTGFKFGNCQWMDKSI